MTVCVSMQMKLFFTNTLQQEASSISKKVVFSDLVFIFLVYQMGRKLKRCSWVPINRFLPHTPLPILLTGFKKSLHQPPSPPSINIPHLPWKMSEIF